MQSGAARTTAGRSGFTLIELLVALSIVALALAFVPANMIKLYETMQYRSAVRDLLSGLKTARTEALRTGVPVQFTLDTAEYWFGIGTRRVGTLPESLRFAMVIAEAELDADRGSIRFHADGSSTGGSIRIQRPSGDGVRLRVDWLLGRVSQEPLD